MTNNNALKSFLILTVFGSVAAHANLLNNEGFECGSVSPTVSANSASSLCNWYQWANSGPVVTTVQSMSNVLEGGSSAYGSGNAGVGLYQYGFFGPGFFTAGAWFNVQSGSDWLNAGGTSTSPYNPSNGNTPDCAPAAVPEPGTFALMGLGLLGLAYGMRRRASRA